MRVLGVVLLLVSACNPPHHVILSVNDATGTANGAAVVVFTPEKGQISRVRTRGKSFPLNITVQTDRAGARQSLWVEARDAGEQPLARGRVELEFPASGSGSAAVQLWHACERDNVEGLTCARDQPTETGICVGGACLESSCGDGYTDAAHDEQCDDVNDDDQDACARCLFATCGDLYVRVDITDPGDPDYEECDPPDGASCTEMCRDNICGDTHLGPGEECDFVTALTGADYADLDATNTGDCVVLSGPEGFVCRMARCGDGYLRDVEGCDDGNIVGGDGCSADCTKVEICGDRVVDEGEDCDDENTNANDGCDACRDTEWQPIALAGPSTPVLPPLEFPVLPRDIWVDRAGVLYIADSDGHQVVRHDPNAFESVVTVVAGGGDPGNSGDGGPGRAARLNEPIAVAVDLYGNVFVGDAGNLNVRMVRRDGIIETLIDSTELVRIDDLAIAPSGDLLVGRGDGHRLLRVPIADGEPTGPAVEYLPLCGFCRAEYLAVSGEKIFVSHNSLIAEISTGDAITLGSGFNYVSGFAAGPDGVLYTSHFYLDTVRSFDPISGERALVAGNEAVCPDADSCGDGGPAVDARLGVVSSVAVSPDNVLYTGESHTRVVRTVDLNQGQPTIERHLGTGSARIQRAPMPLAMRIKEPASVLMLDDFTMLVAAKADNLVFRIDVGRDQPAEVLAGNGRPCREGDCVNAPTDLVERGDYLWTAADCEFVRVGMAPPRSLERYPGPIGFCPKHLALSDDASALFFTGRQDAGVFKVDFDGFDGLVGTGERVFGTGCTATFPALCVSDPACPPISDLRTISLGRSEGEGRPRGLAADVNAGGLDRIFLATETGIWRVALSGTDYSGRPCRLVPEVGDPGFVDLGQIRLTGSDMLVSNAGTLLRFQNFATGSNGHSSIVAGTGTPGTSGDGGDPLLAEVEVIDVDRTLLGPVILQHNGRARQIYDIGPPTIDTVVGPLLPDGDGPVEPADASIRFFGAPQGIARVNDGWVVADSKEQRLRMFEVTDRVTTLVGWPDGISGDGIDGLDYQLLAEPVGVAYYPAWDSVLVTERGLHTLRRVDTSEMPWTVYELAGGPGEASHVDGALASARFDEPAGLAIHGSSLYVADSGSHVVRRIILAATPGESMTIDTIAGIPNTPGYMEESLPVPALASPLDTPWALAVSDSGEHLYVAERDNHRVRLIRIDGSDPLGRTTTVETVIGDHTPSSHGEGAPARALPVDAPSGLVVDEFGNLFVSSSDVIRVVTADGTGVATGDGTVVNVYGRGATSSPLEQGTSCLSGLAFVPGAPPDELWVLDGCVGALIRLDRLP